MAMEKFLKKYSFFFIFLILVIAAFFRLYHLTSIPPGLYPDEAMNGTNALEANATYNYKVFYPDNNGREGLFINIQAESIKIFGNRPWALRLVSVLFGILTVFGLYLLVKKLFEKESIALFASFFLATSFWHINFSRIGFRAIMAPFFLVWGLYLLFKIQSAQGGSRFKIILSLLAGAMFGLGFHSYIAYRAAPIVLIPVFLWLLFKMKRKGALIIFLFSIGAIIAIAPLANYFYHNPQDFLGRTSQISIFSSPTPIKDFTVNFVKTVGMFFVAGDFNWRHNIAGAPELWWPISILFLIGIFVSLKRIWRKEFGIKNSTLFLWLVGLLLPVIISSEGLPHALRAIIVIPVSMIFAALGLDWLIQKIKNWLKKQKEKYPDSDQQLNRIKKELLVLLFIFFIIIPANSYFQYFIIWGQNPFVADAFNVNYTRLGYYLRQMPDDIKKYVIINDGNHVLGKSMPQQVLMFLTDTVSPENQKKQNIVYILPQDIDAALEKIKKEESKEQIKIFLLISNPILRQKITNKLIYIYTYEDSGILIQHKLTPPGTF